MSSDQPISQSPPPPLQFDRADYGTTNRSASDCVVCKQPIADSYYEANSKVVCPACMNRLSSKLQGGTTPANFMMAFVAGLAAAAVGAVIYYAITVTIHLNLALVAILVGFMVGKAVRWGSKNMGGVLYQLLAVALTYLAVAGMYIPTLVESVQQDGGTMSHAISNPIFWITALSVPIIIGFKSPITLLILGFALFEAWKMNKRLRFNFTGPFQLGSRPS